MLSMGLIDLIIVHLRACLASPKYGEESDGVNPLGARVFASADLEEIMDGEPKPTALPTWYVVPGVTLVEQEMDKSASEASVQQMESVVLGLELNAKDDEWGHTPVLEVPDAKKDILKCLHGWNPTVAAKCLGLDLGYEPDLMAFNGDSQFDIDPNRYIHQFQFITRSWLSQCDQGFVDNACNIEDFLRIFADYKPVGFDTPTQGTFKSESNFPPP